MNIITVYPLALCMHKMLNLQDFCDIGPELDLNFLHLSSSVKIQTYLQLFKYNLSSTVQIKSSIQIQSYLQLF